MDERAGPVRQAGALLPVLPVPPVPPVVVHRYRLGIDTAVRVGSGGSSIGSGGWTVTPEHQSGGTVGDEDWAPAAEGDGAAQAFVDLLRYESLPPVPGFSVVRLVPPPEADGERAVDPDDGPHAAVVVGERVVVSWTRHPGDAPHPGPLTLEHLAEHDFLGVPDTYGLLLWRSPSGYDVPVAAATRYLPRSRDGRSWFAELADAAAAERRVAGVDGGATASDLPQRLGRLVAMLHVTLATPSRVVPRPAGRASGDEVRAWHAAARELLATTTTATAPTARQLPHLRAAVEGLDAVALEADDAEGGPVVQRVHGDLHVGRVLRWLQGLAVVGFDARPTDAALAAADDVRLLPGPDGVGGGELQPAARDLARLLHSLGTVALDRQDAGPDAGPDAALHAWVAATREQVLTAYRAELADAGWPELLDERLLAAFEAELTCRDVLAAAVRGD